MHCTNGSFVKWDVQALLLPNPSASLQLLSQPAEVVSDEKQGPPGFSLGMLIFTGEEQCGRQDCPECAKQWVANPSSETGAIPEAAIPEVQPPKEGEKTSIEAAAENRQNVKTPCLPPFPGVQTMKNYRDWP